MSLMIGPLLLLAAAQSAQIAPVERPSATRFVPAAGATARARASVRILTVARFGPSQEAQALEAQRRTAQISEQGQSHSAILLEFQ